uniref:HECT domain-containing protein n=1 Tax=Schistosoma mansoni TaxID=6183 RepID=A0A5K4F3V6_SCHMA
MHASLASIGRACTIQEDEDPPATSVESSFDMQSVDYIEQSLRSCTSSVDELVTLALSLCHSVKILPNFNKIVLQGYPCGIKQNDSILNTDKYDNNKNQPSSALDEHINLSTISNPIICVHTSSNTSRNKSDDLNHLTYLHRFYLKLLNVVHLDTLNNTVKELSLGLLALLAHSETVLIKETNLLDCILSKFSISSNNNYSFQALYEKNSSNILNDYHEFLLTTLLHLNDDSGDDDDNSNDTPITGYTTTHYDYSSQLGELRILCESLRQCWTQMKRLANEQRNMQYRLNQINASNNCDTILTKLFLDAYKVNSLYSKLLTLAIINSAQYLIYSGVSLLGYMELSRFTHDELWEMTRGIEELSILRGHLHNTFQIYRNTHLYKLICNDENIFHSAQILSSTTDTTSTFRPLSQLISYNLLNDPVDVVFSMSVGCLFSLFAKQRSLRLAHLIYLHMYKFPKLFFSEPDNNYTTIDYNHDLSNKNLLQQEFQKFIQDNHGLLASDYLRDEYEFISIFLDILSQSTDLLYQVQKLQLVYTSAAATAQIRQVEAEQRLKTLSNTNNLNSCSASSSTSPSSPSISHAVSVEGKHGVLVRATSTNHSNMTETKESISKTPRKTDIHHRTNFLPNYISRYQDTLHRSSTLDRYVATGSPVSPYSSISNHTLGTDFTKLQSNNQTKPDDHNYKKDKNDSLIYTTTESSSITDNKEKEQSKPRVNSKKGVQWSDHREVSTRHQIIGRYLEMTWKYAENTLTSLFLSTSSTIIKQRNGNSNNITVNETKLCKSTLIMPSMELLRLGNNICQLTITSDFFPTGLLPVLRKQALRCKEYAIWRNWYEENQMSDYNTIPINDDNYDLQDTSETTFPNNVVYHETCDHLNHNSLYSLYNMYVQRNTVNTSGTQPSFCPRNIDKCHNCCIAMNLQRLWSSKAFLIITDINSIIQLITYMTKLFVNDEQTWMNILSLIRNEIKASGISSIVHHFDISIPDSYKSLLLKLYKAYEFTRRLDVIFIRFLIMLKNICFDEYNKCMKNWNVTLQQIDDNDNHDHDHAQQQTNITNSYINQITYIYQQSIHIELLFIHYENLIKCFKNLIDIVFNNIIYCILYWFGYTNHYVNDEILKEFKQLFNPMNSYFLSSLTSTTSSSKLSVGTTSTIPNSNFDDLIEIKTNLWNVDRNVLIRLARVMGTLSQVNNLLISLDKNIKVWKETLRKTFSHLMNKLIHKYIFNYHNEIVCNLQIENDYLINLFTILLKPIHKTIGNCLNSSTEKIISSENSLMILCEYHHNVFYYIIQPTVIQLFHILSLLLKETSINYDEFIQNYLIIRFQNQVPLNLLQEIYQSIKIHNQSGESSLKCFHSKVFTEHQPDNIIQEQETEKSPSSLSSLITDTKQLKSKLNSGSAGVDFIQSTMVFMSTAMKNTMNKHLPKEPKDKIASFAADVCSNLRLPFRNQTTSNLNNCSKITSSSSSSSTTTITIATSSTVSDKQESLNEYSMENP